MPVPSHKASPELGVAASVICDHETHAPTILHDGQSLRQITVFPGASERFFSETGYQALRAKKVDNMVLPLKSGSMQEPLVNNIAIVSAYSLQVALYALQNPTPKNIAKALEKLGCSGDCDEHINYETLLPLPVPKPAGWGR